MFDNGYTFLVRGKKKKSTYSNTFPNAGGLRVCGFLCADISGQVSRVRFHVYDGMLPTLFLLFVDGAYEFVALSVDVDDFHIGVVL